MVVLVPLLEFEFDDCCEIDDGASRAALPGTSSDDLTGFRSFVGLVVDIGNLVVPGPVLLSLL